MRNFLLDLKQKLLTIKPPLKQKRKKKMKTFSTETSIIAIDNSL